MEHVGNHFRAVLEHKRWRTKRRQEAYGALLSAFALFTVFEAERERKGEREKREKGEKMETHPSRAP